MTNANTLLCQFRAWNTAGGQYWRALRVGINCVEFCVMVCHFSRGVAGTGFLVSLSLSYLCGTHGYFPRASCMSADLCAIERMFCALSAALCVVYMRSGMDVTWLRAFVHAEHACRCIAHTQKKVDWIGKFGTLFTPLSIWTPHRLRVNKRNAAARA